MMVTEFSQYQSYFSIQQVNCLFFHAIHLELFCFVSQPVRISSFWF